MRDPRHGEPWRGGPRLSRTDLVLVGELLALVRRMKKRRSPSYRRARPVFPLTTLCDSRGPLHQTTMVGAKTISLHPACLTFGRTAAPWFANPIANISARISVDALTLPKAPLMLRTRGGVYDEGRRGCESPTQGAMVDSERPLRTRQQSTKKREATCFSPPSMRPVDADATSSEAETAQERRPERYHAARPSRCARQTLIQLCNA